MPEFIARYVTILDFSNPRKILLPDVYQPQSCVIKFESNFSDIGSHCYTVRKVNKNGFATRPIKNNQNIGVIPVSLSSLDQRRIPFIKKTIEYIAYLAEFKSQSMLCGVLRRVLSFLNFYFNQPDLNFSDTNERSHYEETSRRYSAVLKADKNHCKPSKHQLTTAAFKFAEYLYDDIELNTFDYDIISNTVQDRHCTTPLLSNDLDLALALRTTIFESIFDLLINSKSLPYPLKVPKACDEVKDTIWLGYKPWSGTNYFPRKNNFEKHKPREWFDRNKGALITKEQWFNRKDHKRIKDADNSWRRIQVRLKNNNSNHSKFKKTLAEFACTCFLDLLMSMTGLNQQPALDIPWYGGYFIQKANQGSKTILLLKPEDMIELEQLENTSVYLRSIKNRKGYQPVEVMITNRFLPQFERYLQLRQYYLSDSNDARLFPFAVRLISARRHSLHTTFPEIPKLSSQLARASVSDNILTSVNDPNLASQVLQNTPKTLIKHYAAGTQKSHIQGLGSFFNDLGNQILINREVNTNVIETASGNCKSSDTHPTPLLGAPIDSDCTTQEGCFFCKHFCIHADEIDIRKLFSILYYTNKGSLRAHDIDFFNQTFCLMIKRIKALLKEIESISDQTKAMVTRIKDEVFINEELDDYWLAKLNRLEMLTGEY